MVVDLVKVFGYVGFDGGVVFGYDGLVLGVGLCFEVGGEVGW